jgi:hypothetical protein
MQHKVHITSHQNGNEVELTDGEFLKWFFYGDHGESVTHRVAIDGQDFVIQFRDSDENVIASYDVTGLGLDS